MSETQAQHDPFDWSPPLVFAISALSIFVVLAFLSADLALSIYVLFACLTALILILLTFRRKGRKRLSAVGTLLFLIAVFWVSIRHYSSVRNMSRWFLKSNIYKSQLLAQPLPANGEFRHVEWDGWGFAGAGDTTVYLVFDPDDSLATAAVSKKSGKFSGLPCEVVRVQKLESHYYSVLFYTDADWKNCT